MSDDGQESGRFRLARGGVAIEVLEYGARLASCLVPDAAGTLADVVPGFDSARDYAERGGVTGAIVGRYGNRIAGGAIEIGDRSYRLSQNDAPHTMHGGARNFSTLRWRGRRLGPDTIRLELTSADGDEGWPGTLQTSVEYRLGDAGELDIQMTAVSDRDTYVNLLFHGYWNLAGHGSGSALGHWLKVAADHYLPKSAIGVPTGEILSVAGTPFDFTAGKHLGRDIGETGRGYGHNLCLRNYRHDVLRPALTLACPDSGRAFTLSTDQPGLQLYTANLWSNLRGKGGALYDAHGAVALETQLYPNTPNTATFTPVPLRAGERYLHRMRFAFTTFAPGDPEALLRGAI